VRLVEPAAFEGISKRFGRYELVLGELLRD
jgi:hypothetical protein